MSAKQLNHSAAAINLARVIDQGPLDIPFPDYTNFETPPNILTQPVSPTAIQNPFKARPDYQLKQNKGEFSALNLERQFQTLPATSRNAQSELYQKQSGYTNLDLIVDPQD